MLILTRKPGESLYIGDDIKITIVEIKGHQIRVGITAPSEMRIYREEIYLQILEENKIAAEASQAAGASLDGLTAAWNESKGPAAAGGQGDSSEGDSDAKKRGLGGLRPFGAAGGLANRMPGKGFGAAPEVIVKRKRAKKPDE